MLYWRELICLLVARCFLKALTLSLLKCREQSCFPKGLFPRCKYCALHWYLCRPFYCINLSTTPLRNLWELDLLLAMHFCLKCCATRLNPHFCCLQAASLSFLVSLSLLLFEKFCGIWRGESRCYWMWKEVWECLSIELCEDMFEENDLFCCVLPW